ncbi:YciI family protein [Alkalihalobacillus pseudalcaliphilus]|uniref:YciI family protein n=1 Tax=Alkalihalobacillus pseudalcaliphilus TaxID=79884 RepID=UPI00064DFFD9|nr:YciI family protein [Alkalihalobacillus pseudalcaliphilus]KMK76802.1 hypothetical protein AB990_07800 [Alkalihalobacillus pseudalcaliphilus]
MRYLILFSRGVNWLEHVRLPDQPHMPEHAVYVQKRFEQGDVIFAGPFEDFSGGAILIDVKDEEDLLDFIQNDPAVRNEIFTYQYKKWGQLMSKFENINPKFDQGYIDYKHKVQAEQQIPHSIDERKE